MGSPNRQQNQNKGDILVHTTIFFLTIFEISEKIQNFKMCKNPGGVEILKNTDDFCKKRLLTPNFRSLPAYLDKKGRMRPENSPSEVFWLPWSRGSFEG